MNAPDWKDLARQAAVALAGSLAGAARATGASASTLSRRMTAPEDGIGRRLLLHGREGYALTEDGRALAARARDMKSAAAAISTCCADGPRRVRVFRGTWTAHALAGRVTEWWTPDAA